MLLSVVALGKGDSTVGWFEFVAAVLVSPDDVRLFVFVVVMEPNVVKVDGSTANYREWRK